MKNKEVSLVLLLFSMLLMTFAVVPSCAAQAVQQPASPSGVGVGQGGSVTSSSPSFHAASMEWAAGGNAPVGLDALHPPVWDEQMGITFADTASSLHFNVTAVAQADAYGYGPGYLLNGLTEMGFWYQVGVSWQWPSTDGGYTTGFSMGYEVFNSIGQSIFPTEGGGEDLFNGQVNPGDLILLSLDFSGVNVTMAAFDWNSSAAASESFSAVRATTFVGLNDSTDHNGFFSGLMTEWWHAAAYYGGENQTRYNDALSRRSAGVLWADEWAPVNGSTLFGVQHYASFSNATSMEYLGYSGCQMAANAFDYLTGGLFQAPTTLSYSVLGGGAGSGAPVLAYWSNATQVSANLTATPSVYQIDLNSVWNVSSSLPGGTGDEMWRTSQNTSYTVSVIKTYSFAYYHQFRVTFGLNVVGGTGYSTFSVSAVRFGSAIAAAIGAPVIIDAQSSYLYPNPLPGSGSAERWATADPVSGIVTGPAPPRPTYYDQLSVAPSYAVQGGAGASSPPQLLSQRFGGSVSLTLTGSPVQTWLDRGAPWNVSGTLAGSGPTERWQTAQPTQGVISTAEGLSFTYYHQYLVGSSYRMVSELPILPVPGWPVIEGTQFGLAVNATTSGGGSALPSIWLDGGTSWSISDSQYAVGGAERWATNSSSAGIVGADTNVSPVYYDQFLFMVAYSVNGGGSPEAPTFNYSTFGTNLSSVLASTPTGLWLDKGSPYSVTPVLGVTDSERWTSGQQVTAAIAMAGQNLTMAYTHQFYVTIFTNYLTVSDSNEGGTLQPATGWFDSGEALTLAATPSPGWGFEGWQGTGQSAYSGNLTQTTIQLTSAIEEEAVFYPAFTISVVGPGSVYYSTSDANGMVQEGETRMLFLPPNETVTLKGEPSSFFYKLETLNGTSSGPGGTAVSSSMFPTAETAIFTVDWVNVLLPNVLVAIGIVLAFLLWRRRREPPGEDAPAALKQHEPVK